MALSREQILAADDRRRETVQVPEWGGDGEVLLASMTGSHRLEFLECRRKMQESIDEGETARLFAFLIVRSIVDADGNLLFTDEDIPLFMERRPDVLLRIYTVAVRLNRVDVEGVEEQKKSSSPDRSDNSPSGSPSLVVA